MRYFWQRFCKNIMIKHNTQHVLFDPMSNIVYPPALDIWSTGKLANNALVNTVNYLQLEPPTPDPRPDPPLIFQTGGGGGGGTDFSHKKGGVSKVGWIVLKKLVSLIFILTNPSQCYLSLSIWCYVCVFCLFTPFLSVLFVFHRMNLIL